MIADYGELIKVLFQSILILGVLLFIFRKHIISFFDPLLFYLVTQAFSIELGFLLIQEEKYLVNFLLCQVFFIIGFMVVAGKPFTKRKLKSPLLLQPSQSDFTIIKVFALVSFVVIFIANIFLIKQAGIALFSDDPSQAKGENFTAGGGLGLVRRMNWGIIYISSLFLVYLYLFKTSRVYLLLFFVLLVFLIFTGSKGVLIYFITLIPLLSLFKDVKESKTFKLINYSKYFFLAGGIVLSLLIIIAGSKGTLEEAMFGFVSRLLFYGDAMLYYYDTFSVRYFSQLGFIDFFKEDFNTMLGFFRLAEYKRPLGFEMVDYQLMMVTDTVFGPNVPYYVKGHIYFGPIGALVYSFFVGAVVGGVRLLLYRLLENPAGTLKTLAILHLNLIIVIYPQDSNYFMSVLFDTFILSLPVYLAVFFVFIQHQARESKVLSYE